MTTNINSTIDIVKNSISVDASGTVSFRTRLGRGSGAAFKIGADQFEEFVSLLQKVRDNKETFVNLETAQTNDSDGN